MLVSHLCSLMEAHDSVKANIWCSPQESKSIKERIDAEIKDIIWTDKTPIISLPIINYGFESFNITLTHGGDIEDDSVLARILYIVSKCYASFYFHIGSLEGDLLLIETLQNETGNEDFPEGVSIVHNGIIYPINEDVIKLPDAPKHIKEPYSNEIQQQFTNFFINYDKSKLYHNKTLRIPKALALLLEYNPSYVTDIIKNAKYTTKCPLIDTEFISNQIKFRKFQIALLDSKEIRVPREFEKVCPGQDYRTTKLSYLLLCAYENMLKEEKYKSEIEKILSYDLSISQSKTADDSEEWLDEPAPPVESLEGIGSEMAERLGEFVHEVSEFDKIEGDGPVNFDVDALQFAIEHFLDSSDEDEDEYESEEDILEAALEAAEDVELHSLAKGKGDATGFASACLEESIDAQPSEGGPAADYVNLFGLK